MIWTLLAAGIITILIVLVVLIRIWSENGSKTVTGDWSSDSEQ